MTEVIPELFDKNNNAHEMMVTVAKLLIESEDIPGISKERLADAHKRLGENPTDETVEKLFLDLAKDNFSICNANCVKAVPICLIRACMKIIFAC